MKKQMKPLIITAIICVVLAGALFAVFKLLPKQNVAEQAPITPGTGKAIYIVNKNPDMVKRVDFTTDSGEKFTIEYRIDEQGTQIGSIKGADPKLKYNQTDLFTLAGYVGMLSPMEEIKDAKGRADEFGFKKPQRKIEVEYTDNEHVELLLGSKAPSGDGMYIQRKDTGRVYLIGGTTMKMLMKTPSDYRDIMLYEPYSDISSINSVSITRPDEAAITVRRKINAEPISESNPTAPQYEVISPDEADASNQPVEQKVLTPLIAIKSEKLVEDNPKDLKKYGLDKPVKVEFKDNKDETHTLLIGSRDADGKRYIMSDGAPSVMLTEADIPFLEIKHPELMMQLLWLHNTKDVDTITYRLPDGKSHVLKMDVNDTSSSAIYDGGQITAENATNLFMHTVQFTMEGAMQPSMKYKTPELSMTMKLKSGKTTTFQLARINERQYAAIVDGQPAKYYVNASQLNALIKAFEILGKGGQIPSIF